MLDFITLTAIDKLSNVFQFYLVDFKFQIKKISMKSFDVYQIL